MHRDATPANLDELVTRDDRAATVTQLNDGTGSDRQYQHTNAQYHTYAVTDSAGLILERYEYSPYGALLVLDANGTPVPGNTSNINQQITYTGQRLDPETSNYYFKNRYYDPAQGKFISRDPLGYVDGMNLYAGYFAMRFAMDMLGLADVVMIALPYTSTSDGRTTVDQSEIYARSHWLRESANRPESDPLIVIQVNGFNDAREKLLKVVEEHGKIEDFTWNSHGSGGMWSIMSVKREGTHYVGTPEGISALFAGVEFEGGHETKILVCDAAAETKEVVRYEHEVELLGPNGRDGRIDETREIRETVPARGRELLQRMADISKNSTTGYDANVVLDPVNDAMRPGKALTDRFGVVSEWVLPTDFEVKLEPNLEAE